MRRDNNHHEPNHDSQRYKTISSDEDTRHPTTTKKKIVYTPLQQFRRSNPYMMPDRIKMEKCKKNIKSYSLQQQISQLQDKRQSLFNRKKYLEVERIQSKIHRATSALAYNELRKLSKSQNKEKSLIQKAHKNEVKHFNKVWREYFIHLRDKEQISMFKFRQTQQRDIEIAKFRLTQKCQSFRHRSSEIIMLEKRQSLLAKEGRFQEIHELEKQKRQERKRQKREREVTIEKWTRQEEQVLLQYHTKKYRNLIQKLQESRKDKEKNFLRQQKRLKQKYKNVLRQLDHEQKIEMNIFCERILRQ